jgi:hypothetical protein
VTASTWWVRLKATPWFRRSVRTFLQAFLALMVPGALGWLHDLTEWSRAQGQAPFPDPHSLAFVGVQAITAGVIAVVTALWTVFEDSIGKGLLRTVDPGLPPGERGHATSLMTVSVVPVLIVLAILLM